MKDFILPPYEHVGASFNPRAHAETRLEIGGKKRNFVLKMRDGVIYFKEPSRAPIFAIPLLFAPELAEDSIGLISAWQREVAAGNYGVFVAKREYFEKLPVRSQFLMIWKADGTGWMREWFDESWFELPQPKESSALNIWNNTVIEEHVGERLRSAKRQLLSRAIDPKIREDDLPRWIGGSSEEFAALVIAGARLLVVSARQVEDAESRRLKMKSHSAFARGSAEVFWLNFAGGDADFISMWEVFTHHFMFLGVRWSEGGEQSEHFKQPRVEHVYKAGLERFGPNWRGNWAPQRASFTVQIPDLNEISAHEKLESALLLREWLRGKMPDTQIDALLQDV